MLSEMVRLGVCVHVHGRDKEKEKGRARERSRFQTHRRAPLSGQSVVEMEFDLFSMLLPSLIDLSLAHDGIAPGVTGSHWLTARKSPARLLLSLEQQEQEQMC